MNTKSSEALKLNVGQVPGLDTVLVLDICFSDLEGMVVKITPPDGGSFKIRMYRSCFGSISYMFI